MDKQKYCAYLRVSTVRQGQSGLGLQSQKDSVTALVKNLGGDFDNIRWFVETESGKKNDRKQLASALAHCKRSGETLVFARIDRLSRKASFFLSIIEADANVLFCDLPHIPTGPVGKMILTTMVAFAEMEGSLISQRTKAALKVVKETKPIPKRIRELYPNGVPEDVAIEARKSAGLLGSARPGHWAGKEDIRLAALVKARAARIANLAKKESPYADLMPIIESMEREGKSLKEIAAALNSAGHTTSRGAPFQPYSVGRVLGRY